MHVSLETPDYTAHSDAMGTLRRLQAAGYTADAWLSVRYQQAAGSVR